MINEQNLRDALLSLILDQKVQYRINCILVAEIQSLREAVRPLDPAFSEVLDQKRRDFDPENDPAIKAVLDSYDQKFQQVKDGYVC